MSANGEHVKLNGGQVIDIIDYYVSGLTLMPMAEVLVSDGVTTFCDFVEVRDLAVTA